MKNKRREEDQLKKCKLTFSIILLRTRVFAPYIIMVGIYNPTSVKLKFSGAIRVVRFELRWEK